ncbi:hypothetical protein, partial [Staphylococcus capitis]
MSEQDWRKSVVYQIYPKSFNDTTGNGAVSYTHLR